MVWSHFFRAMFTADDDSFTIGAPDDSSINTASLNGLFDPSTTPVRTPTGFRCPSPARVPRVAVAPAVHNMPVRNIARFVAGRSNNDNLNNLADQIVNETAFHATLSKYGGPMLVRHYHGFGSTISTAVMGAHTEYHRSHRAEWTFVCPNCFVCQMEHGGKINFTSIEDKSTEVEVIEFNFWERITNK